jgi:outer membrane protein
MAHGYCICWMDESKKKPTNQFNIKGVMKKICFLGVVVFVTNLLPAQQTYSLKQCVETAIANNPLVKQSEWQLQTAQVNWQQARANFLPAISAGIGHGINQGRSIDPFTNAYVNQSLQSANYGASVNLPLFNGLNIQNTVRQNSLSYEAAKMDLQQNKDNTVLSVVLAYLQVLNNEDVLDLSRKQVEVTKQQAARLEKMNREGAIPPAQLYDLKGQLADNELAVVSNLNAWEAAKLALCQLMNIDYNAGMQLERWNPAEFNLVYQSTVNQVYDAALKQMGLVKAADLRKQSASKAVLAARGNLFPSISLVGNANSNYSSAARQDIFIKKENTVTDAFVTVNGSNLSVIAPTNFFESQKINYSNQLRNNVFTYAGVNVTIPIFNNLQNRNRVKLAKITEQGAVLAANNTRIQLRQDIERAYLNMTAAANRYTTLLQQVEAFKESYRTAEVRFNEGVINSVDYVIAKNNYDRSVINFTLAKYEYLFRTKVLDYYQGKLMY